MSVKNDYGLTDRDRMVILMSARGYNIEDIGEKIGASKRSVYVCRHRICDKLSASNMTEVVHYLHMCGLWTLVTKGPYRFMSEVKLSEKHG